MNMKINPRHTVTVEANLAFQNGRPYMNGDTEVKVLPNVTVYCYHGHEIGFLYNDPDRTLSVQTSHLNDRGFRDRLNSLDDRVNVMKSNNKFYLNGIEWSGELADVFLGMKYVDKQSNRGTNYE